MNQIIIFCASYLFLFVIAGSLVALWRLPTGYRWKFIAVSLLACAVAFIVARIASRLYFDPRPFVSHHVKPLIAHAADNGFPSDHALLTMTLTAVMFFYRKRIAAVMLAATIVTGIARVFAKVHSPLDIVTAWAIAIVAATLAYAVVQYITATVVKSGASIR